VASFTPDDVSGPTWEPGTANYWFGAALPDGSVGRAFVGTHDAALDADDDSRGSGGSRRRSTS
jgi:hypothetical protein